jgi:hypothetical protein
MLPQQRIHTQQPINLKGRDHLEDIRVDGKIILKRILNYLDVNILAGIS